MTEATSLKDKNVLVIEDEALIAASIEDTLHTAGASKVTIASNLEDAQRCIDTAEFDAAILDIRLPDGNTIGTAKTLMERKTPFLFHSGYWEPDIAEDFPKVQFCTKPSSPNKLLEKLVLAIS